MVNKKATLTIATIISAILFNSIFGFSVNAAGRSCGLRASGDDILIDIVSKVLWANETEATAQYELSANIPAGTYKDGQLY